MQIVILVVSFIIASFVSDGFESELNKTSFPFGTPFAYVPITLHNTQGIGSSSDFDLRINVDWQVYRAYVTENMSNVRFYDSFNFTQKNELHAWLENNDSNTALSNYVWINMSRDYFSPFGNLTIYMVFLVADSSWDRYWGVAADRSKLYGQFDNGATVFPFYWNWSGNSVPNGWSLQSSSDGSVHVDNGLWVAVSDLASPTYAYAIFTGRTFTSDTISSEVASQNISPYVGGMTANPAAFSASSSPNPQPFGDNVFASAVGMTFLQTGGGTVIDRFLQNNSVYEYNVTNDLRWLPVSGTIVSSEIGNVSGYENYNFGLRAGVRSSGSLYPLIGASGSGSGSGHPGPASFEISWTFVTTNDLNNTMPIATFGTLNYIAFP